MLGSYPDATWYWQRMNLQDHVYRLLFKEPEVRGVEARVASQWNSNMKETDWVGNPIELSIFPSWPIVRFITDDICSTAPTRKAGALENDLTCLSTELTKLQNSLKTLSKTDDVSKPLVEKRILPGEGLLSLFFGSLELLRAVWKICETIRSAQNQKAAHRLKNEVKKKTIDVLAAQTEAFYALIQEAAKRAVDRLQGGGEQALVAQAGWGETGLAIMELMQQDEVRGYARLFVDSGVESIRGVLKVKLK